MHFPGDQVNPDPIALGHNHNQGCRQSNFGGRREYREGVDDLVRELLPDLPQVDIMSKLRENLAGTEKIKE